MGMRKPEARAFTYIADEIGISPDRILFFDDHPENVEGAKSAVLNAVLFDGIHSARDAVDAL